MSNELKRMQELAGVPVNEEKENLNEHQIGGVVGIGAIHTPKREKSDYEMAFEHYMNEGEEKEVKEEMHEEDNTMEEAVGIDASAEAIRGEVRRLINKFDFDEDLGAAIRSKFSQDKLKEAEGPEEVKRMKEYLLKQMKQKGHLSYETQIKYLKRFKDSVVGDNPRSMAKKDAAEELLKNSEQELAKKIEQLR
jgi:hypothetical protein